MREIKPMVLQDQWLNGYGTVSAAIMKSDVTAEAKAIYAYFCSLSGDKARCFPRHQRVLEDLGMAPSAFYKHYNMLIKKGFIVVQRSRNNNLKGTNTYILPHTPTKENGKKYGIVSRHVMMDRHLSIRDKAVYACLCLFCDENKKISPCSELIRTTLDIGVGAYRKAITALKRASYFIGIAKKHEKQPIDSSNTNIPSRDTGSLNQSLTASEKTNGDDVTKKAKIEDAALPCLEPAVWQDPNDPAFRDFVSDTLREEQTIPAAICVDRCARLAAIRSLTDWDIFSRVENYTGVNAADERGLFLTFTTALDQMLAGRQILLPSGNVIGREDICDALRVCIDFDTAAPSLFSLREESISRYRQYAQKKSITNPAAYMSRCIWTAMQTFGLSQQAECFESNSKKNNWMKKYLPKQRA